MVPKAIIASKYQQVLAVIFHSISAFHFNYGFSKIAFFVKILIYRKDDSGYDNAKSSYFCPYGFYLYTDKCNRKKEVISPTA